MNRFEIIGRLGGEPREIGEAVFITLATSRKFKKDNDLIERTDWNDVVLFGRLKDTALKYLGKGDLIYCDGSVRKNKYEKAGQTIYTVDLVGRSIQFLNLKSNKNGNGSRQASSSAPAPSNGNGNGKSSPPPIPDRSKPVEPEVIDDDDPSVPF